MITFDRMSLWDRLLDALSPKRRALRDAARMEALRWLMDHPEAPCSIGGVIVPNGYGTSQKESLAGFLMGYPDA